MESFEVVENRHLVKKIMDKALVYKYGDMVGKSHEVVKIRPKLHDMN
jgi:hypothetical protein